MLMDEHFTNVLSPGPEWQNCLVKAMGDGSPNSVCVWSRCPLPYHAS